MTMSERNRGSSLCTPLSLHTFSRYTDWRTNVGMSPWTHECILMFAVIDCKPAARNDMLDARPLRLSKRTTNTNTKNMTQTSQYKIENCSLQEQMRCRRYGLYGSPLFLSLSSLSLSFSSFNARISGTRAPAKEVAGDGLAGLSRGNGPPDERPHALYTWFLVVK